MRLAKIVILAVSLLIQCEYLQEGRIMVDFVLQGEQYEGVHHEDMLMMVDEAVMRDLKAQGKI